MEANRDLAHNLEKHQRENDMFEMEQAKLCLSKKLDIPLHDIRINITRYKKVTSVAVSAKNNPTPAEKADEDRRLDRLVTHTWGKDANTEARRIRQEQEEMDDRR